jgi:hypothetical protein
MCQRAAAKKPDVFAWFISDLVNRSFDITGYERISLRNLGQRIGENIGFKVSK